jgi:hypothetical protein
MDIAGGHRLAVDDYHARAALAQTAAETRALEFQIVAQHVKQWRLGVGVHCVRRAVYINRKGHGCEMMPA